MTKKSNARDVELGYWEQNSTKFTKLIRNFLGGADAANNKFQLIKLMFPTFSEEGSIRSSGYNAAKKTDADEHAQRYKVVDIINHPFFTEQYDYDFALLKLDKKINLGEASSPTPICLPPANTFDSMMSSFKGKNMTVSGWGMADEKAGGTTRILQKLDVPWMEFSKCKEFYGDLMTRRMICLGFEQGVKDACTGDSGGPLVFKTATKQWQQFGIVSWGKKLARSGGSRCNIYYYH